MPTWVLQVGIVTSLVAVFLARQVLVVWRIGKERSTKTLRIELLEPSAAAELMVDASAAHATIESAGYTWFGLIEVTGHSKFRMYSAVWVKECSPERSSQSLSLQVVLVAPLKIKFYQLLSQFDDSRSLTTSNSKYAVTNPRIVGNYAQAFPSAGLELLIDRHTDAEQYLERSLNVKPYLSPFNVSVLEREMNEAERLQAKFIRSHWLWPLRSLWWHYTTGWRCNKSVEQRFGRQIRAMSARGVK